MTKFSWIFYPVFLVFLGEGFLGTSDANLDKYSNAPAILATGRRHTDQHIADISSRTRNKRQSEEDDTPYIHPLRVLENHMDTEFLMKMESELAKEYDLDDFLIVRGLWENMTMSTIEATNGTMAVELMDNITEIVRTTYPKLKMKPANVSFSMNGSDVMFHYLAELTDGTNDYDGKAVMNAFTILGADFKYVFSDFYTYVDKTTVYQTIFKLTKEPWEVYYKDLTHIGSRKMLDILLQYTRQMYRNKFGEFFYRSLINGFIEGADGVIVHSMVLLDPSVYNVVDTEDVWNREARNGTLGKFKLDKFGYLVRELKYVPASLHQYLIATETRDSFVTNATSYFVDIALPIFGVMFFIIFFIFACA